jgi:hypothetical protein
MKFRRVKMSKKPKREYVWNALWDRMPKETDKFMSALSKAPDVESYIKQRSPQGKEELKKLGTRFVNRFRSKKITQQPTIIKQRKKRVVKQRT